jgi:ABC-type spermidine/putrescine transport system permease subunit II
MKRHHPVALTVLVVVLVVLYAPLLFVAVSGMNRNPLSTGWQGATWQWYRDAWGDRALRRSIGVSLRLGAVTTVLAVVLGTAVAVVARHSPLLRAVGRITAALRVATPEIVIATGLAALIPAVGLNLGFRSMLIAHVAYLTAYVILIVGARAAQLDPDMERAAADLGAGPWTTLTRVIVPELRPAIGASALLVLAFSLDDVALSLALRGPTDTTLPVYLYSVVQRRVTPSIHAVGTVVILAGAALFLAAIALHNLLTDRTEND